MEHTKIPGPSSTHLVASMTGDDTFNPRVCIICQEDNKLPLTSEKTGRERIKQASKIHNDIVAKRIETLMGDDVEDNDNGPYSKSVPA